MKRCTWQRCRQTATTPQLDRDNREWACLCDQHHAMLDDAISGGDVKKMMSYWISAQGGPRVAARKAVSP